MTFECALSPLTRLGSLPDPGETASNLSPKADSALKLSDTAYPGGPTPGLIQFFNFFIVYGATGFRCGIP